MFPKITGKDFRLLKKMHALVDSSKYLRKISKTSFLYGLAAFLCAEEKMCCIVSQISQNKQEVLHGNRYNPMYSKSHSVIWPCAQSRHVYPPIS